MPELPEVETTVRLIRPDTEGRRIVSAQVGWLRTLGGASVRSFRKAVIGARIERVWRRAKYIVFDLQGDDGPSGALLVHLRMSGRLVVEAEGTSGGPYARVSLGLDDDRVLHFLDVRKFGRFVYVADADTALAALGPEPLGATFTAVRFHAALRARRGAIKPLLLNQAFLAGLGNIYVDESLFRARIHPLRSANTLSRRTTAALHTAIQQVLKAALVKEGSSFDTFYRTPEGQPGSYQDQFQVYGRQGKACRRCEGTVRRLVVGQRGTHVCLRCQRPPRTS